MTKLSMKVSLGGLGCLLMLVLSPMVGADESTALRMQPVKAPLQLAAANPCAGKKNPCNPCMAKANPCNPCMAKKNPCNPCMAKANPCNPCMAKKNPCNPCGARNPCGAMSANAGEITRPVGSGRYSGRRSRLVRRGERLWNDSDLSTNGLTCNNCHMNNQAFLASFVGQYPHEVAMAKGLGIHSIQVDEMVQLCMVTPMAARPLPWESRDLAALAAYSVDVAQQNYIAAVAANPCMAKRANPCNPCRAGTNPCNPCAAKAKMTKNPCNPCARKNPCARR